MLIYKGFDKDNTMLFMIGGEDESFLNLELDYYRIKFTDKLVRIDKDEL